MKWWNVWWKALKDSWLGNALYWLGVVVSAFLGYMLGRLVEGEMLGGVMLVIVGVVVIASAFAVMRIDSMKRNVLFVVAVAIISSVFGKAVLFGHHTR